MVNNLDKMSDKSYDQTSNTSTQLMERASKHISFLNEVQTANETSNRRYKDFTNQLYTAYLGQHSLNKDLQKNFDNLQVAY